ncbi:hypothetical protein [[Mycoplasma] cavipharyngis]
MRDLNYFQKKIKNQSDSFAAAKILHDFLLTQNQDAIISFV